MGITLGVWNLSEQPTIYFMTTAKLLSWGEYKPTIFHLWKMQGDQLQGTNYKYDYIMNPDIIDYLSSYNCNLKCYSTNPLPEEVENYRMAALLKDLNFLSQVEKVISFMRIIMKSLIFMINFR